MAELLKLTCQNCSSPVQIKTINGHEFAYCEYCGTTFLIQDLFTHNPVNKRMSVKTICRCFAMGLLLLGILGIVIAISSGNETVPVIITAAFIFFVPACLFFLLRWYVLFFGASLFGILLCAVPLSENDSWACIVAVAGVICAFAGIMIFIFTKERKPLSKKEEKQEHKTVNDEEDEEIAEAAQSFANHKKKRERKSKAVALFLCLFLGFFGAHKFYEGKTALGFVYMFTGGLFIFGWVFDLFVLMSKRHKSYRP